MTSCSPAGRGRRSVMAARRDELTDTAADAAIDTACRVLRLPTIRDRHGEVAAAAARQQAGYKGFLTELLFQVFTEREEKASVAVASNATFSEWTSAFTDPRLCAAIVHRLTFYAHIIQTAPASYPLPPPAPPPPS